MSLKDLAKDFLEKCTSGNIEEAYAKHVAPHFRHHNAYFKGDREALKQAMIENAKQVPNKNFQIQRMLEDGDLVACHSKLVPAVGHPGIGVVHIMRFQDFKIVEMWDLGQAVDPKSPNENGMF